MSALVGFDTTFLALMFIPDAKCAVAQAKERVNFLVSDIHGRGDKIVVPTPALSELLVKSGRARNAIIQELSRSSRFVLAPFDVRAALELSLMTAAAFTRKDKRSEEHTSELQSRQYLVCRLLLEKKKKKHYLH